jgi:predicted phosphodiesterase
VTRYAVISDIHANLHALHAAFARIDELEVDDVICLGDIVGYGPDPDRCLDLVTRRCGVSVMGNHDLAVLDPAYVAGFNVTAREALRWTRDILEPMHLDALNRMRELEYIGRTITCVHDNPLPCSMTYIYDQQAATLAFRALTTPIALVGHTHLPMVFETRSTHVGDALTPGDVGAHVPRDGVPVALDPAARTICNPGSVGQPRDGDPRASLAVLDLDDWTFTVHRVRYDIAATQLASQKRGLPAVLAHRLAVGA